MKSIVYRGGKVHTVYCVRVVLPNGDVVLQGREPATAAGSRMARHVSFIGMV